MIKYLYVFLMLIANSVHVNSHHYVLISAPGSGKGTFSQYMTKKHDYVQICPGDMFRKEILQQTELGKAIASIVDAGDYVDEKIVCALMKQNIQEVLEQKRLFILDGFPRSEESLEFLLAFLAKEQILDKVCFLQLEASDRICKERMLGRYVCNACNQVDNANLMAINNNSTCSFCGENLTARSGDKDAVIDKRLIYFHAIIEPLLQKLEADGYLVKRVDSVQNLSILERIYDEISF